MPALLKPLAVAQPAGAEPVLQRRQPWRGAVEGWFGSLGAETVLVTFEDVQASHAGELASVSAIVTDAGTSAQGEQLR